jgi:hypothetical protein
VLYLYRVIVEDKSKLQLRLWAPSTEDEKPPPAAVATSHS